MNNQTVLLFVGVLLASGCMSGGSDPGESFEGLLNDSESSIFRADYSVSGPAIEDEIDLTVYRKGDRKRFRAVRETPGGTVISESYRLENRTVSCYTSPSPKGGTTRCTVGPSDGIYTFLNPDRWAVNEVNNSGKENISGRECSRFSASIKVDGQGLDPDNNLDTDICLDSEKGFISEMNVSSESDLVSFRAENYSGEVSDEDLGLPRAVGIAGHCTDSFDVELTPLKDVNEAVLSVNGENTTVSLPGRFETEFYSISQQELDTGENTITVYTEEGTQSRYCYYRP